MSREPRMSAAERGAAGCGESRLLPRNGGGCQSQGVKPRPRWAKPEYTRRAGGTHTSVGCDACSCWVQRLTSEKAGGRRAPFTCPHPQHRTQLSHGLGPLALSGSSPGCAAPGRRGGVGPGTAVRGRQSRCVLQAQMEPRDTVTYCLSEPLV